MRSLTRCALWVVLLAACGDDGGPVGAADASGEGGLIDDASTPGDASMQMDATSDADAPDAADAGGDSGMDAALRNDASSPDASESDANVPDASEPDASGPDASDDKDAGDEPDADAATEELAPSAWPTDDVVTTLDAMNAFGTDVSGISYQPNGAGPGVIWAVMNLSPTKVYRLQKNGAIWERASANEWTDGKALRFPDGLGVPDSEGVTKAEWASSILYVGSERNLQAGQSAISRPSVLAYDSSAAGTTLTATQEWNLTASLPAVGANLGIEAITWIPDNALVAAGFIDELTDAAYDPASYPTHGSGLFVVGLESQSDLYFYALGSDGSIAQVAVVDTELSGVMGLEYDRDVGYLWAHCDNACGNVAVVLSLVPVEVAPATARFERRAIFTRPASLPNINNEGIAISPESECVAMKKPFYWLEDGTTDGHVLRTGTIPCGAFLDGP